MPKPDSKDILFNKKLPLAETIISGKKEDVFPADLSSVMQIIENMLVEKYDTDTYPGKELYKNFSEIKYSYIVERDHENTQKKLINFYRDFFLKYFSTEVKADSELKPKIEKGLGIK